MNLKLFKLRKLDHINWFTDFPKSLCWREFVEISLFDLTEIIWISSNNHESPCNHISNLLSTALRFGENDPIVQIEYDTTRQLLYTRSDNGSIYVYDLAEDGQGSTSVV